MLFETSLETSVAVQIWGPNTQELWDRSQIQGQETAQVP